MPHPQHITQGQEAAAEQCLCSHKQHSPLRGHRCFQGQALISGIFSSFHQSNLAGISPEPFRHG